MHISVSADQIIKLGPISITNSMLGTMIVLILLLILTFFATRKLEMIPKGLQNIFELIVESLLNLIDGITINKKLTVKIFPLVSTFFIFILFNNWSGLIPGIGSIGFFEHNESGHNSFVPFLRAGTADLNTTIALSIITVFAVQIIGITTIGIKAYIKKFINFSSPINFFVGIIELISEVSRIISYAFRLFGNIFAGEVLLTVMSFLVPLVIPLPFYAMEIFVGFIQALVFAMLSTVFMTLATIVHEDGH